MDLKIRDLSAEGLGIGSNAEGRVFFCPAALPGEIWECEIKGESRAEALKCLIKSQERRDPPCPHFADCGGCQIQHLNYEAGLRLKHRQVFDKLTRIGGLDPSSVRAADRSEGGMSRPSPEVFGYRNNVRFHVEKRGAELSVGFRNKDGQTLTDLDAAPCLIASAEAEVFRRLFKDFARTEVSDPAFLPHEIQFRQSGATGECHVSLFFEADRFKKLNRVLRRIWSRFYLQLKEKLKPLSLEGLCAVSEAHSGRRRKTSREFYWEGRDYFTEQILGKNCKVSAQGFFQVNTPQAEQLISELIALTEPESGRKLWDIYGGSGTLGMMFADLGLDVTVIEIHPGAEHFGLMQAESNGLQERMRFYRGDASKVVPKLLAAGENADYILTDPPRAGLKASLIEDLAGTSAQNWLYVSCDPATLARDLKRISQAGFELRAWDTFDMFPWTMHVETAVLLSKTNPC